MTFKQCLRLKVINQEGYIYLCLGLFAALGYFLHLVAAAKIGISGGEFIIMNQRTEHNILLIGLVQANAWIPALHALLAIGGVIFLQLRGHPRWTLWMWSATICAPWVLYLDACVHIGGKFILFDFGELAQAGGM